MVKIAFRGIVVTFSNNKKNGFGFLKLSKGYFIVLSYRKICYLTIFLKCGEAETALQVIKRLEIIKGTNIFGFLGQSSSNHKLTGINAPLYW
jgi:hypothetical protein